MSLKLKIICALEAEGLLRQPKLRKHWTDPFLSECNADENFNEFYRNIRNNDDKFFSYFRMSKSSFDELLKIIETVIKKEDTLMRKAISVEKRLTITLR